MPKDDPPIRACTHAPVLYQHSESQVLGGQGQKSLPLASVQASVQNHGLSESESIRDASGIGPPASFTQLTCHSSEQQEQTKMHLSSASKEQGSRIGSIANKEGLMNDG